MRVRANRRNPCRFRPPNLARASSDVRGAARGVGPYQISLTAPPPANECTTLLITGANLGHQLRYLVLPGDANMDATVSTQDLLFLIQRLNDGSANQPANLARCNINRSQEPSNRVNTQDLLRLVQLLNGTNATQPFNGATLAACPP